MTTAADTPLAVITGAGRGLGAALAGFLLEEGYDLIATSRSRFELENAARAWPKRGNVVHLEVGDVTTLEHRAAIERGVAQHGGLTLLVNNASELGPSPPPELADYPLASLRRVLEVNVVAPLALVQSLLPWLERDRGSVVNVSSDAALGGYPGWGGYGASKAALDLLTLTLAQELRPRGVSVMSVDPGDMRTAMHQAAYPDQDLSDRPLPTVTLPFWAWLVHQDPSALSGHRFRAQADRWEIPA